MGIHRGTPEVAHVVMMVGRSRIMQPTPDKMDVISAEAQTGCWGTAVPRRTEPENGAALAQRS